MVKLYEYSSPQTIAGHIIFSRKRYTGTYLLVEGESDYKVLKRFVNSEQCKIEPVGGKGKVFKVLQELKIHNQLDGVIGIVDQDYLIFEQSVTPQNVIYTDVHDLECLILKSPALEKVLDKWANDDLVQHLECKKRKPLREILLDLCAPISMLKYLSMKYDLRVNFHKIDDLYSRFIYNQNDDIVFDIKKFLELAESTTDIFDSKKVQHKINTLLTRYSSNFWLICNGHQLTRVLAVLLEIYIGKKKGKMVNPKELEQDLYLAYEVVYFIKTELFRLLLSWQEQHSSYEIFNSNIKLIAKSLGYDGNTINTKIIS